MDALVTREPGVFKLRTGMVFCHMGYCRSTGKMLIIRDQLVNPPTWFASFRDLTLFVDVFMHSDVVIESLDADIYVKWLRQRGGMDFVKDIIRPGSDDGVRLDIEHNYPRTLVTDRIAPENMQFLLIRLQHLLTLPH
jgi:hypothetical protein